MKRRRKVYSIRSDCIIQHIETEVVELLKTTNRSCTNIGKQFGCSRGPIWNIQKKHNIVRLENPKRLYMKQPCKWCGELFYPKKSTTRPNRGKYCSRECYGNWLHEYGPRGSEHHYWRDDAINEDEIQKLRKSREWKEWRINVFQRDNYTCQVCGVYGGELHPHHIISKVLFPEDIFNLCNGITLCSMCHRTRGVHRNRKNTYVDLFAERTGLILPETEQYHIYSSKNIT